MMLHTGLRGPPRSTARAPAAGARLPAVLGPQGLRSTLLERTLLTRARPAGAPAARRRPPTCRAAAEATYDDDGAPAFPPPSLLAKARHSLITLISSKLRRAGRRLPRPVRDAGAALATAVMMMQSPKLMRQVDDATVAVAYDICVRHLTAISPSAGRNGLILSIAASIAFSLLVVAVLLAGVLYWRGFI